MRGVSNVVSAVFVIALILVAGYTILSSQIYYAEKLSEAGKESVVHAINAAKIAYESAKCDANTGLVTVVYGGSVPEYDVRLLCTVYPPRDTIDFCVVPVKYVGTGETKVITYVDDSPPLRTMVFDLNKCANGNILITACQTATDQNIEGLLCYAIGWASSDKWILTDTK